MTKQEALDMLTGWKEDHPDAETEDKVRTAIEHGATENEVADRMGILPDTLRQKYGSAISEAGRLGHVRGKDAEPVITQMPESSKPE